MLSGASASVAGRAGRRAPTDGAYHEHRRDVLERMLRLHPDVLLDAAGQGSGYTGDRLLLLGADYRDPATLRVRPHWAELERVLHAMRVHQDALTRSRRQHMLHFFQAPTRMVKRPQPVPRLDRYKRPMFTENGQPLFERGPDGKPRTELRPTIEAVVASWVSKAEAYAGLSWLEQHYALEPFLPVEAAA